MVGEAPGGNDENVYFQLHERHQRVIIRFGMRTGIAVRCAVHQRKKMIEMNKSTEDVRITRGLQP